MFLLRLQGFIDGFSDLLGRIAALLFILLLFNVFYDVAARYLFNSVNLGLQELEWHLYASMFMLGIPFALKSGSHVRVDVIYDRLSARGRAWIDLFGSLLLLLPFTLLIAWYGVDFVKDAYSIGEGSPDPGGLPHRWVIKSVIPFAMLFNFISGIGFMLAALNCLLGHSGADCADQASSTSTSTGTGGGI
ncbi:TRAP transporter small permease subunit [Magnetovirga frankeli]|uniref:TRAP transporter small permease subunit n=1 Tax=Magnetovirga frankeli TaxID=947516 RepID=UPI001293EECC|nr:TRAP transporter small permease subunit [gamma proteobacterium SS-5]